MCITCGSNFVALSTKMSCENIKISLEEEVPVPWEADWFWEDEYYCHVCEELPSPIPGWLTKTNSHWNFDHHGNEWLSCGSCGTWFHKLCMPAGFLKKDVNGHLIRPMSCPSSSCLDAA